MNLDEDDIVSIVSYEVMVVGASTNIKVTTALSNGDIAKTYIKTYINSLG